MLLFSWVSCRVWRAGASSSTSRMRERANDHRVPATAPWVRRWFRLRWARVPAWVAEGEWGRRDARAAGRERGRCGGCGKVQGLRDRRDRRSWSRGRARFGEDGAGAGGRRADRAGGAGGWRVALRGRHAPGRFVRCRSMMSWMSRADGCRERVNRRQAEASQCAICRVRVLPIGVARIKIPTVGMYARIAQTFARALGWLARSAKVFQAGCFT